MGGQGEKGEGGKNARVVLSMAAAQPRQTQTNCGRADASAVAVVTHQDNSCFSVATPGGAQWFLVVGLGGGAAGNAAHREKGRLNGWGGAAMS